MELAEGQVHLWLCRNDVLPMANLHELIAGLDAHEQSRYHRFKFEKDKTSFLLSHLMLRRVLANYLAVSPNAISFSERFNKKPFLSGAHADQLVFNLSHTKSCTALALTRVGFLGCDVENIRQNDQGILDIAEHYFTQSEREHIFSGADIESQLIRFFRFWALKESYMKATGEGMKLALEQIEFTLNANHLNFQASGKSVRPGDWRFLQSHLKTYGVSLAICLDKPISANDVRCFTFDWSNPALDVADSSALALTFDYTSLF